MKVYIGGPRTRVGLCFTFLGDGFDDRRPDGSEYLEATHFVGRLADRAGPADCDRQTDESEIRPTREFRANLFAPLFLN